LVSALAVPSAGSGADLFDGLDLSEAQIEQLEAKCDQLRARVSSMFQRLCALRGEEILDPNPEDASSIVTIDDDAIEARILIEKTAIEKLEAESMRSREIGIDRIADALASLGMEDAGVATIPRALREVEAKEAALLQSGVRANDPRLTAVQAQIRGYRSTLSEQLEAIRRARSAKLDAKKIWLAETQQRRGSLEDQKKRVGDYIEVKSNYLVAKAQLAEVEQRYLFAVFRSLPPERIRDWRRLPAKR
jgi:hypothetical protein